MKKAEKISDLTKEFVDLLKKGNITLEELYKDPTFLATHPDFDRAIEILATLDDLYEKP